MDRATEAVAGKLYTVDFYPSDSWLLGCGGSGNQLSLWHLDSEEALRHRFGNRSKEASPGSHEKGKNEDFEAMMAERQEKSEPAEQRRSKKKGKGKGKKKVHRKGR